jgi:hypothetical protein
VRKINLTVFECGGYSFDADSLWLFCAYGDDAYVPTHVPKVLAQRCSRSRVLMSSRSGRYLSCCNHFLWWLVQNRTGGGYLPPTGACLPPGDARDCHSFYNLLEDRPAWQRSPTCGHHYPGRSSRLGSGALSALMRKHSKWRLGGADLTVRQLHSIVCSLPGTIRQPAAAEFHRTLFFLAAGVGSLGR